MLKKFMKIVSISIGVVILICVILEASVIYFGQTSKGEKSDCIVVLGCSVFGKEPSPFLKTRLNEGLRLYKEDYAKYIIVSGGQGPGEEISEAEAMKEYLVSKGVPEDKIIKEENSFNTRENLHNSKKVMDENKFKNAIIVSNRYHLKRASILAKYENIDASFSGITTEYKYKEFKGYIREVPGIIKDIIVNNL